MCVARINLLVQSAMFVLFQRTVPQRPLEVVGVAAFWIWYPTLVSCLPFWRVRVAFVLSSFTASDLLCFPWSVSCHVPLSLSVILAMA
jgi:acyl-lipid Delta6-acetylenase / acyl-lipid (9-3)-desaturase